MRPRPRWKVIILFCAKSNNHRRRKASLRALQPNAVSMRHRSTDSRQDARDSQRHRSTAPLAFGLKACQAPNICDCNLYLWSRQPPTDTRLETNLASLVSRWLWKTQGLPESGRSCPTGWVKTETTRAFPSSGGHLETFMEINCLA